MAAMVSSFNVPDYDEWKALFDADRVGRKETATSHLVSRAVDDPNHVFVRLEFPSVEAAQDYRDRLLGSGILDNMGVETVPTVVEVVDQATY